MQYRISFLSVLFLLFFATPAYPTQQTQQPTARSGQESVQPGREKTAQATGVAERIELRQGTSILDLKFNEGEEVVLHSASKKSVVIFDTLSAMQRATAAMDAKDLKGVKELVAAGEIFTVSNNTKVLILETTYYRTQPESVNPYAVLPMLRVKFLSGEYFGESGWVLQGAVKLIEC